MSMRRTNTRSFNCFYHLLHFIVGIFVFQAIFFLMRLSFSKYISLPSVSLTVINLAITNTTTFASILFFYTKGIKSNLYQCVKEKVFSLVYIHMYVCMYTYVCTYLCTYECVCICTFNRCLY